MKQLSIIALAFFALSCGNQTSQQAESPSNPEATTTYYGEKIDKSSLSEYDMLKTLTLNDGKAQGKLEGKIIATCSKKGCWMEVDMGADTLFVKFKDYGFFVPTEGVEGKTVIMDGVASLDTVSVDELQHYAEDAGKSEEEIAAITEEAYKVRFVASGVIIE